MSRGSLELRKKHSKREQMSPSTPRPTSSTRSDTESTSGIFSDADECQNSVVSYKSDENAKKFYRDLEEKHNSPLPEYMKNLLFLNGFTSMDTFSTITDEDMTAMERMCKQEMHNYCPHTPDFFSFFFQCIEHFKIPLGHRKQLMGFIEKINEQKMEEKFGKRKLIVDVVTPMEPTIVNVKEIPMDDPLFHSQNSSDGDFPEGDEYPEMSARVRRQIERSLCDSSYLCQDLEISVKLNNTDIEGSVQCPICSCGIKLTRDNRRKDKNGIAHLSASNFIRHVKKHNEDEEPSAKKKKTKSNRPSSVGIKSEDENE
ncbi:uncharacterized protein LOC129795064 [Lutzomyia longipalpis]|uniref:uncharacterized protein LOC129795064 n=1 Tax=Lutzomyia longipalpis TaxID=7200 RepID=UPI002483FF03|nr:uncharacterized protein LOC129795064 [Lutzomyia longipalpis]XP_055692069.1 uncharacterized protein LOC129795064 [Lutzomyia longipalpis]